MSKFKIEVIADSSGKWAGNAMKYDSFNAAKDAAVDLAMRWLSVRKARVVEFNSENENEVFSAVEVF